MSDAAKSILKELIGWSMGGQCNDCTPFRSSPAAIEFLHHKDCGYLEAINKANLLLGYPFEKGHDLKDPEAEMVRLANERAIACRREGLIKSYGVWCVPGTGGILSDMQPRFMLQDNQTLMMNTMAEAVQFIVDENLSKGTKWKYEARLIPSDYRHPLHDFTIKEENE